MHDQKKHISFYSAQKLSSWVLLRLILLFGLLLIQIPISQAQNAPSLQQSEQSSLESEIKSLETEIVNDQKFAADKKENAKGYKGLAEKTDDKFSKKQYEDKAALRDREAERILKKIIEKEKKLAGLKEKLGEKQRADKRLKVANEKSSNDIDAQRKVEEAAKKTYDKMNVQQVLGLWRFKDGDRPFVLVQQDPSAASYQHELEAHTMERVWKGQYISAMDQAAVVELTYKPKASEMNPEVPEWAREKVEGNLMWRLNVEMEGTCGTPRLVGVFHPGKIGWDENGEDNPEGAWVEGKGDPIEYPLYKGGADLNFDSFGSIQLYLRLPGKDYNTQIDKIEGLIKRQKFYINVVLPPEIAKKHGRKLTVKIEGLENGDDTKVELESFGNFNGARSLVYSHNDQITIADDTDMREESREPTFLSLSYILGNKGARLDLDVDNEEQVKFSFEGASQTVPIYNSWVQRKIARHKDAVSRLRNFYGMVINSPSATKASKEAAVDKLRMLLNYEAIKVPKDTKIYVHDYMLYAVGEMYFRESGGLLSMSPGAIEKDSRQAHHYMKAQRLDIPLTDEARLGKNHKSGLYDGVIWTSYYERAKIMYAMNNARKEYRNEALNEIPQAFAFALYSGVAAVSSAGDVYTLITGDNIFGKKAKGWERIMSAVGLAGMPVLTIAGPRIATMPTLKSFGYGGLSRRASSSMKSARIKEGNLVKMAAERRAFFADVPSTVKTPQLESAGLSVSVHQPTNNVVGCAMSSKVKPNAKFAEPPNTMPPVPDAPRPVPESTAGTGKALLPREIPPVPGKPRPLPGKKNPKSAAVQLPEGLAPMPGDPPPVPKVDLEAGKLQRFYESDAVTFLDPDGAPLLPPQKFETCACESMKLHMFDQIKMYFTEMLTFSGLVKAGKVKPGDKNMPLKDGFTDVQARAMVEMTGGETIPLPHRLKLSLDTLGNWMKNGWGVRHVLNIHGEPHAVAIRRFKRNEKGDITEVHWYDPAFGKEVRAPVCEYVNRLADGYDTLLFRWNEKPPKNRPTIEYPSSKKPPPKSSRKATDPDNFDPLAKDDVPELKTLDDVITYMYEDAMHKIPKLNAVPQNVLDALKDGRVHWQAANTSGPGLAGASFSYGKALPLKKGAGAIRIKSGRERYIEFIDVGTGYKVRYWESGEVGVGNFKTYIPREHLQYTEPSNPGWHDLPP